MFQAGDMVIVLPGHAAEYGKPGHGGFWGQVIEVRGKRVRKVVVLNLESIFGGRYYVVPEKAIYFHPLYIRPDGSSNPEKETLIRYLTNY